MTILPSVGEQIASDGTGGVEASDGTKCIQRASHCARNSAAAGDIGLVKVPPMTFCRRLQAMRGWRYSHGGE